MKYKKEILRLYHNMNLNMLPVVFITLIYIGGAFGRCISREQDECNYETVPQDFPSNLEELTSSCQAFLKFAKCILKVNENCEDSTEITRRGKELMRVSQMKDFLEENCDPQSVTFRVLSENIGCASPVLNNVGKFCEFGAVGQNRTNVKIMKELKFMERLPGQNIRRCLGNTWDVVCAAAAVSDECGSEVLAPLTDSMINLNYELLMFCPQEIIDDIRAYANDLYFAESGNGSEGKK